MDESLKLQISNVSSLVYSYNTCILIALAQHEDTFDVNNPSLHLLKSLK